MKNMLEIFKNIEKFSIRLIYGMSIVGFSFIIIGRLLDNEIFWEISDYSIVGIFATIMIISSIKLWGKKLKKAF